MSTRKQYVLNRLQSRRAFLVTAFKLAHPQSAVPMPTDDSVDALLASNQAIVALLNGRRPPTLTRAKEPTVAPLQERKPPPPAPPPQRAHR